VATPVVTASLMKRHVHTVLRLLVGSIFLASGALKLISPDGTSKFISRVLSTGEQISHWAAIVLAITEVALGLTLLTILGKHPIPSLFSSALILSFLLMGAPLTSDPIQCGCFGEFMESATDTSFLLRNFLLLFASMALMKLSQSDEATSE